MGEEFSVATFIFTDEWFAGSPRPKAEVVMQDITLGYTCKVLAATLLFFPFSLFPINGDRDENYVLYSVV